MLNLADVDLAQLLVLLILNVLINFIDLVQVHLGIGAVGNFIRA